jgi:hypothetical protein
MAAAKDRPNTVIIAHLRRKMLPQGDFFVACYHMYVRASFWLMVIMMGDDESIHPSIHASTNAYALQFINPTTRPCEFRRPPIMTVHAALLVQRIQALAAGSPHVVTVRAFLLYTCVD